MDGPLEDPSAAQRLAGGSLWFGSVHLVAREDQRRSVSAVVPIMQFKEIMADFPAWTQKQAQAQWEALTSPREPMAFPKLGRTLRFDRPHLMGILNMTPDSFSDGGEHSDPERAVRHAFGMANEGAAIIDIGAESTRPGAEPVWEGDEIERLKPIVEQLASGELLWSADTRKASVMHYALEHGASLINDVSGLTYDPQSMALVAQAGCPVVLMHAQGSPQTMQDSPFYDDVLLDIFDWFTERLASCERSGVQRAKIILDPGLGFGKSLRHNLDIMNGLALFHALGCPLLLGASRKRFIGALSRAESIDERLPGSLAVAFKGLEQGVQLLRVHDVTETHQVLHVWQGIRDACISPLVL